MLKAYVGIANPDGVVCFFPDQDHWTRSIAAEPASFWAVLADGVADQIYRDLEAGERFRALQLLDTMANEIYPIGVAQELHVNFSMAATESS